MKAMSEHYHTIFIDIIGMGNSSRYPFTCQTAQEAEDYFMRFMEEWRKAMGLEKFYLSGHSFGGYLVALYASLYPQYILKLQCVSAIGFIDRPDNFDIRKVHFRGGIDELGRPI